MYEVIDLLDDLDGHDANTEIQIQLADGTKKKVAGVCFINSCIGGDNIIYITEKNPLREKYEERVEAFIDFADIIIKECDAYYHYLNKNFEEDYDPSIIFHLQNELGKECDTWFKTLKLDIKYEVGVGSEEELSDKLYVLRCWLKGKDIPKDIRP